MKKELDWHRGGGFKYVLYKAKSEKPSSLIIYLHGMADNATHFTPWAKALQKKLPEADIIVVQAPVEIQHPRIPSGEKGYAWVPIQGVVPKAIACLSYMFNGVSILKQVENFAHRQLKKRGLKEDRLVYVGFSMGAIVALQVALSGEHEVAAVAAISGVVLPFTSIKNKPLILMQMGGRDEHFHRPKTPANDYKLKDLFTPLAEKVSLQHEHSMRRLREKNVDVIEKVYPEEGHIPSRKVFLDAIRFVAKALSRP